MDATADATGAGNDSRTGVREVLRTFAQAVSLSLWRRPSARPAMPAFGAFALSALLSLLLFFVQDHSLTPTPASVFSDNMHEHASYFLALLVGAWLAARVLGRPVLWLPIATFAVLVGTVWNALSLWVLVGWLGDADDLQQAAWKVLLALGGFIALLQTIAFLSRGSSPARRLAATLVFAAVLAGPWYGQQEAWFWYPPDSTNVGATTAADGADDADEADEPGDSQDPGPPPEVLPAAVDPERLMESQPARVQAAVDAVRAQQPGRIDLFTMGFAGDGSQRVFRNEVDYLARLAAERFDGRGRTLELVNSPATLADAPLATLSNLRDALAGVAARMDPEEDVLLLFLTSHGHQDKRLFVGFDPLPLRQISPADLRTALDDAHIGWRVVVVSACYSGGFVDALRDPRTLVITAARADRTSFGCGNDSQITWFGKAFLADAMNRTTDFERGFELASHDIREWELRDGETPSVPQIATGAAIRRHLAEWRKQLPEAPAVPFDPAPAALPPQGGASASE